MQIHIGTKLIKSKPMNRVEYNEYQGWDLPFEQDGEDEGYLVEYMDGGKPNHPDHEGYISWSPKEQHDNAYRPTTGMSFGLAIEAMRMEKQVARRGWNGKGIYVELMEPDATSYMADPYFFIDTSGLESDNPDAPRVRVPWAPSQTDMLAFDWEIVE